MKKFAVILSAVLLTVMSAQFAMAMTSPNVASDSLKDVQRGSWYEGAVSDMMVLGIMKGYDDKTFHPIAAVTRAEIAVIIGRVRALIYERTSNVDFMLCYGLPDAPVSSDVTQEVKDKYKKLKDRYCSMAKGTWTGPASF